MIAAIAGLFRGGADFCDAVAQAWVERRKGFSERELVSHEDLSAHLTSAAIRADTGHPDVLIDAFASSLLADFYISRKK
ncbi:hypothetical protein JDBV06_00790 [Mycobacterium phage dwieneke]|nr:hypothetical protein JDBV06_00790 [Mycobacterium phage dwieneke]